MAPFKFIDRVFNGLPIQQYGDGSTSRDYTYIDDIAAGVVSAIDRPLGCEVINLGNGRPYLLKDFISLVETCVGKNAIIQIMPEQPGDVDRTCADISKAAELLGYAPKVPFEEGISRTANWYRKAHSDGLFDEPAEGDRERSGSGASTASSASDSDVGLDISVTDDSLPVSALESNKSSDVQANTDSKNDVIPLLDHLFAFRAHSGRSSTKKRSTRSRSADPALMSSGRRILREESDLELSSFVQKASKQYKVRTKRILDGEV